MGKPYEISQSDDAATANLLVGHSVIEVKDHTMILDNGTTVEVQPNEGCGGCSNGRYQLEELNRCEAVITSVRLHCSDDDQYDAHTYTIFVLAANKEQVLLSVKGDDDNGYYGTGYQLLVKVKE